MLPQQKNCHFEYSNQTFSKRYLKDVLPRVKKQSSGFTQVKSTLRLYHTAGAAKHSSCISYLMMPALCDRTYQKPSVPTAHF